MLGTIVVSYCERLCSPHYMQKYNERKAMAMKGQYKTEEEKETWMGIINAALMSSDSSGEEEGRGSNYCSPTSMYF